MKICFVIVLSLIITAQLIPQSELSPEEIYEKVNDAVVIVLSYDSNGELISQGSGVVLSKEGYVLTNYHIMSNANNVGIFHDGKLIENVEIIGGDVEYDFLVLRIPLSEFSAITIAELNDLKIGQRIYAIGSPVGYENTLSEGIISGIRQLEDGRKLIQITASISPGSSGGAVVDSKGELIGISTYTVTEGQNINFAIPINDIKKVEIKPYVVTDKIFKETKPKEEEKIVPYIEPNIPSYDPKAIEYLDKGKGLMEEYYSRHREEDRTFFLEQAIENFEKAVKIDPNLVEAYYLAGKYQATPSYLYNYENAKNYYSKVERIIDNSLGDILTSPSNREILLGIATFYVMYGHFEESSVEMSLKVIEIYKKTLEQPLPFEKEYSFIDISDNYVNYQITSEYHLAAVSLIYNSRDKLLEAIQYCDLALEYYQRITSDFKEDSDRVKYFDILKDKKLAESLWLTYDWKTFYSVVNRKAGILISADNILFLYHPKTLIKEKNKIVRTWIKKINLTELEKREYDFYDYSKSLYEFDLKNNKYRVLQYTSYYDNKVLDDENYPNAEWQYVIPETIAEIMIENMKIITK